MGAAESRRLVVGNHREVVGSGIVGKAGLVGRMELVSEKESAGSSAEAGSSAGERHKAVAEEEGYWHSLVQEGIVLHSSAEEDIAVGLHRVVEEGNHPVDYRSNCYSTLCNVALDKRLMKGDMMAW